MNLKILRINFPNVTHFRLYDIRGIAAKPPGGKVNFVVGGNIGDLKTSLSNQGINHHSIGLGKYGVLYGNYDFKQIPSLGWNNLPSIGTGGVPAMYDPNIMGGLPPAELLLLNNPALNGQMPVPSHYGLNGLDLPKLPGLNHNQSYRGHEFGDFKELLDNGNEIIERSYEIAKEGAGKIPKPGDSNFIGPLKEVDAARAANWMKPDGTTWWPPNDGAVPGTEKTVALQRGTEFGRIGGDGGSYVAPPNTSPEKLALKPGTDTSVYNEYRVIKDIPGVQQAEVAGWFDMPGGGTQFKLPASIKDLIDGGYIELIIKN